MGHVVSLNSPKLPAETLNAHVENYAMESSRRDHATSELTNLDLVQEHGREASSDKSQNKQNRAERLHFPEGVRMCRGSLGLDTRPVFAHLTGEGKMLGRNCLKANRRNGLCPQYQSLCSLIENSNCLEDAREDLRRKDGHGLCQVDVLSDDFDASRSTRVAIHMSWKPTSCPRYHVGHVHEDCANGMDAVHPKGKL